MAHESLLRGVPTRDGVLTPPTAAELDAWYAQTGRMAGLDLGTVYTGISKMLGSLKASDREVVLKRLDAQREVGWEAGGEPNSPTRVGESNSASVKDHSLREMRDSTGTLNSSLNEAARKRWGQ
jgi:hypothetical protein